MSRKTRVREHSRANAARVREHERVIADDPREAAIQAAIASTRADTGQPFVVDMRQFQEADDGNTSHYGGEIVINEDERLRGYGSDRGDNSYEDLTDAILRRAPAHIRNSIREKEFGMMDLESEVQSLTPGRRYKLQWQGTRLVTLEEF
jgi:hypothetical protein